jgi:hypothetical protein
MNYINYLMSNRCKPILVILFLVNVMFAHAQVTVNPGSGSYATVNAAFTAINAGTHTGAITVEIASNTTEPAAPVVLAASGVGAANYSSIEIYPTAANVIVAGTSSASRGVLEFNGADNITINGNINNGSGTSRNLTIQNNTANTNVHAVLWFQSSATSPQLGCTNIVVKNTKIIGNANVSLTRTTSTPFQPAVAFSSTTFPTSTTTVTALNNSNISFDNNEILRCFGGLHFGQSTTAALTGLSVTNNTFGSSTAADYCIFRALYIANCSGAMIQGNTLLNIRSTISSSCGAIELSGATGSNNTVSKNVINGVSNTSTGGWASAGIYVISGNSNTTIENNVIYDLQGANYSSVTTTFNTYGIRLTSGTGHKIWYNSINLFGTISSGTTASASTALGITSTTVTGLDIRNNIFSNLHVSTVTGYQAFCIRYSAGYPFTTAGNTVNNNYYSVPSSNTATTSYFLGGTFAAGVTYANLAALQTATGQDAQSLPIINVPAPFTANNNLVIPAATSTGIESGGVAIAALGLPNTDFTGVNRPAGSGTAPDIGAYEFEGVAATGCTGAPANGGTASASSTSICAGNSTSLSASGYTADIGIEYNWQSGPTSSGPFTDISGANSPNAYTSGALTADTYFRLRVTCTNSSQSVFSNILTISVNNPQLISTSPASLCGTGTVTLGATPNAGTVNWYTSATGGSPIGTGTSFTTPVISSTTSYWAAASSGGTTQTSSNGVPTVTTSTQNGGVIFNLNTNVTINSIQVYSTAAGTATVTLMDAGLTTLYTSPALPITAGTLSTPQTLTLGWSVPAGSGYRILVANTGNALGYATGVFPAPMGNGVGTIVNGALNTSTSTLNYFVYNINTTSGCESSPRVEVVATVSTAPAISASTTQSLVCSGGATTLNVSSSNDPDYTYTWTSTPAGFNASGASVNANPAVSTTYTVTATDNTAGPFGGCTTFTTVAITAQPSSATVTGSPESICAASGSTILGLLPASGYPTGSIQWQSSPTGSGYTDISGATGNTYNSGTISSTTFYRALIKDGNDNVCISPSKEIVVGVPTVDSTTPNTRCGIGTTSLQATGSAGSTIKWYTTSTGGSSIGTGSPFTTPVISNTTTYYAEASTGSTPFDATIGTQTTTTQAGMPFRAGNGTAMRTQYLYTAAELSSAGLSAGSWDEFKWTVTTAVGAGSTMGNMTIRVGHTGVSALTSAMQPSPATTVYGPTNYVASAALGDITFTFTTPFTWDGSSNVLIEICHDNPSPTGVSGQVAAYNSGFVSVSAVGNVCGTATGGTTQSTRPIIKIAGSAGCASSRVPVVATVTPAPAVTASATELVICPGGTSDLSVTSPNDPDYTYAWTSSPAGFTATGPGPHSVSPSATTKYYVTATDLTSGPNQNCVMIDSVTIVNGGTLVAGTVTTNQAQLCVSGSTTLTVTGASGGSNQWQESTVSASGPWTNVGTGATTYNSGTITQTTYYRVVTSCGVSSVNSNVQTVVVNNPEVLTTTPATRCGTGSVTLAATASSGATLNWYTTASGGSSVGSGTSFTTPNISTTTNYYVAANSGGSGNINVASPTIGSSVFISAATGWGLRFTVNSTCNINSVTVKTQGSTAGPASIQVKITDLADVVLYTGTLHNFNVTTTLAEYVIPVNISNIAPGDYKMQMTYTGLSNMVRESGGVTFPYNSTGNEVSITAGANGVGTAQTTSAYYWFYNWVISSGCEGPRSLVTATVNPAPAINAVTDDPGLCTGGSTNISVSSSNDPNYTYTWTSAPAGFTQTGAGPFSVSPTVTTKYYVDAVDNTAGPNSGCVITDSVTIIVAGTLVAGTVTSSESDFCLNGSPVLTLTGSQGAIQWQSSTVSATGPWTNVGSGIATYNPSLTQTTYIRASVSCQSSSVESNVVTITVNNPSITATAPATRCGAGTVILDATASSGATLNWYDAATGGSPLYTGNNFTTPVIASTTNFWVSATSGGSTFNTSKLAPEPASTGTILTTYGQDFTVTNGFTLNSVQVFSTTGTSITVALYSSGGTTQLMTSGPVAVTAGSSPTINLGWYIAPGTYRLCAPGMTGNFIRDNTGVTYPFALTGIGTMNGFVSAIAGAVNTSSSYYFLYNWSVSTGCESTRTPVTATVTSSPAINASATFTTPCAGNPTDLSVTSSNAGYTYSWTSTPAGFTGTGSGPLTATPTVATTYQVLATDNSGGAFDGCGALATVAVTPTVNNLVLNVTSSSASVCPEADVQLNAVAISPGYTMSTNCGVSFIDIATSGTSVGTLGDDLEYNITFPSFTFNGVAYTSARVGTNGVIVFGATTGDVPTANAALPATTITAGNVFLAPYWDDLDVNLAGTIKTQTVGNVFIVQWTGIDHNLFTTGGITFQVQMNLTTGEIAFIYPDATFGSVTYDLGVAATIGLQFSSTSAQQFSFNTASLVNGMSICFVPNTAVFTYDWSANSTFLSATNIANPVAQAMTSTQTYSVTITDASTGCTKTQTKLITVNPAPVPSIGSNAPVCQGQDINLFGNNTASGQTTGNSFTWSGPNGFISGSQNPTVSGVTPANTGYYVLTVQNSFGCSKIDSIDVQLFDNPALNILSQTNVLCNGDLTGGYTIEVTNSSDIHLFTDGSVINFDGIFSGIGAGTYTVEVTNGVTNCLATIPVTITEPDPTTIANAGTDQTSCFGNTATLAGNTALVGTGSWSVIAGGATVTDPSDPNSTVTGLTAGLNTFRWTIDNALCANSNFDEVDITTNVLPTASISGTTEICNGNSASLTLVFTGTAPFTYSYSNGVTTFGPFTTSNNVENVLVSPTTTRTYTVTAIDDSNCPGTTSGSALVTVTQAPPGNSVTVTSIPVTACVGNTIVLTTNNVIGATGYTWSAPAGTLINGQSGSVTNYRS